MPARRPADVLAAVYRGVHEVLEVQPWLASDATGLGVCECGAVGPADDVDLRRARGYAPAQAGAHPGAVVRWIPMGRTPSRMVGFGARSGEPQLVVCSRPVVMRVGPGSVKLTRLQRSAVLAVGRRRWGS